MRILRYRDPDFARALTSLQRKSEPTPEIEHTVRGLVANVRARGDAALLEYTAKFGGPLLRASELRVTARAGVDAATEDAIAASPENVRDFGKRGLRKTWTARNRQGAVVGERFDPFQRVGIYVPGGTAPLVSTAIMTCTLAQAAGCPEIVAPTPTGSDGRG